MAGGLSNNKIALFLLVIKAMNPFDGWERELHGEPINRANGLVFVSMEHGIAQPSEKPVANWKPATSRS